MFSQLIFSSKWAMCEMLSHHKSLVLTYLSERLEHNQAVVSSLPGGLSFFNFWLGMWGDKPALGYWTLGKWEGGWHKLQVCEGKLMFLSFWSAECEANYSLDSMPGRFRMCLSRGWEWISSCCSEHHGRYFIPHIVPVTALPTWKTKIQW
jgi:hypothetical protein